MARKRSRRHPGDGSVWLRSDTGRYQAALVVGVTPAGNPRRIRRSFDSRAEATAWLADRQRELFGGTRLNDNSTLQDVYDDWISTGETLSGWAPATVENYRSILTRHVLPALGRVRVRDIGPADVRKLLKDLLQAGVSASGVRRARSYLSMLLL